MRSLGLAVTHLNAPFGDVLSAGELALALQLGTAENSAISSASSAIISSLFTEVSTSLIFSCIREAGSNLDTVNQLYKETLNNNMPKSADWEKFVEVYI